MDADTLNKAINDAGCPTVSSTVLDPDTRAFWSFTPVATATPQQIEIGHQVINAIPVHPTTTVLTGDFIARWTNAEYRALQDRRMADNGKTGKDWDIVTGGETINFNMKKTQTLKTNLVADGILTQARADEIFQ